MEELLKLNASHTMLSFFKRHHILAVKDGAYKAMEEVIWSPERDATGATLFQGTIMS